MQKNASPCNSLVEVQALSVKEQGEFLGIKQSTWGHYSKEKRTLLLENHFKALAVDKAINVTAANTQNELKDLLINSFKVGLELFSDEAFSNLDDKEKAYLAVKVQENLIKFLVGNKK